MKRPSILVDAGQRHLLLLAQHAVLGEELHLVDNLSESLGNLRVWPDSVIADEIEVSRVHNRSRGHYCR